MKEVLEQLLLEKNYDEIILKSAEDEVEPIVYYYGALAWTYKSEFDKACVSYKAYIEADEDFIFDGDEDETEYRKQMERFIELLRSETLRLTKEGFDAFPKSIDKKTLFTTAGILYENVAQWLYGVLEAADEATSFEFNGEVINLHAYSSVYMCTFGDLGIQIAKIKSDFSQRIFDDLNSKFMSMAGEAREDYTELYDDYGVIAPVLDNYYAHIKICFESNWIKADELQTAIEIMKKSAEIRTGLINLSKPNGNGKIIMLCPYSSKLRNDYLEELAKYNLLIKSLDSSFVPPAPPIFELPNQAAQGNNKKSGGCYVATVVYGSYDCPPVWVLRRYRDNNLASSWYGRLFIKAYYAVSPTLVKYFGETVWFKALRKKPLDRLVERLRSNGVKDTEYDDVIW